MKVEGVKQTEGARGGCGKKPPDTDWSVDGWSAKYTGASLSAAKQGARSTGAKLCASVAQRLDKALVDGI